MKNLVDKLGKLTTFNIELINQQMTEVALKELSIDTLFDLMIQTFQELLDASKKEEGKEVIKGKKKDMELLQRVIAAKAEALLPVDRLIYYIFTN
jgi:hypothetical protein